MDNQTRQYGYPEPERRGENAPKRERPKQYFPDQSQANYQQQGYQPQYQQPQYQQPQYQQPRYEQQYQEPYYAPEPQYQEPEGGSSAGTIALGVIAAVSFVAATVLFFLWRGAAAEADKPPVTETVTHTTTETETSTTTTTKFPSIFERNEEPTATLPPEEPLPEDIPPQLRDDARDFLDQLREGADQFFQEQQ